MSTGKGLVSSIWLWLMMSICLLPMSIGTVNAGETGQFSWMESKRSVLYYGSLYIGGQPAPVGVEVGAFAPDGACIGGYRITTAGQYGLMKLCGNDGQSCYDNGTENGENITFLVYWNGNWYKAPQIRTWNEASPVNLLNLQVGNEHLLPTAPPSISNLNPAPESAAFAGTSISMNIQDDGGIDPASLNLWVNCEQIVNAGQVAAGKTVSLETSNPRNISLTYFPTDSFPCGSSVEVVVRARDQSSIFLAQKDYTFSIEDTGAPVVTSRNPENGATDIAVDSPVLIRIQDDCMGIDSADLQLFINGIEITGDLVIQGTPLNRQVTYKPAGGFDYGEEILVFLMAEDGAGNQIEDQYSFITLDDTLPPYITGRSPANGASGVSPNTPISFHIRDDGAGIRRDTITLEVKADGGSVPGNLAINGIDSDIEILFTPLSPFSVGQEIMVLINASDLANNSMTRIEDTQYSFFIATVGDQDNTAPYLGERIPDPNAIDVPGNQPIKLNLRDDGAGVNQGSIHLYINNKLVQPQEISGNSQSYDLIYYPAPPFNKGQRVTVRVEAQDLASTPNPMSKEYSFRIGGLPRVVAENPLSGAVGVPPGAPVQFQVLDEESGVDINSLQIVIDGDDIPLDSPNLTLETLAQGIKGTVNVVKTFAPRQLVNVWISACDLSGNCLEGITYSFSVLDLVPPENVEKLRAMAGDCTIDLNWAASADTAGDLAGQRLYISRDGGQQWGSNAPDYNDGRGISLPSHVFNYHLTGLQNGLEYTCKITCFDAAQTLAGGEVIQNESGGIIVSAIPQAVLDYLVLSYPPEWLPIEGRLVLYLDKTIPFIAWLITLMV